MRFSARDRGPVVFIKVGAVAKQNHGTARVLQAGCQVDGLQRGIVKQGLAAPDKAVDDVHQGIAVGRETLGQIDAG